VLSALTSAAGVVWAEVVGETRVVPEAQVVPPDRQTTVVVRDVRGGDDAVSGVVANRASDPVRNVRLLIDHVWLWGDERHPGDDDFSRLDDYVVPQEIPPGGQVSFTVRPSTPLHEGPGGRFMTDVTVGSFEILQQRGAGSPSAGTRSVEPPPERPEVER